MRRVHTDFGLSGGDEFASDTANFDASGTTGVFCKGSAIMMRCETTSSLRLRWQEYCNAVAEEPRRFVSRTPRNQYNSCIYSTHKVCNQRSFMQTMKMVGFRQANVNIFHHVSCSHEIGATIHEGHTV